MDLDTKKVDIILLSGKQGSGKTTTALAIQKEARKCGYDYVTTMKFATPLYELHEFILNRMERYTGKKRKEKDGLLLQLLGTEWGRFEFGSDVWCDIVKHEIEKQIQSKNGKKLFIIDDCRFVNEFDAFEDALRVRLEAPPEVRRARTEAWRENTNHISEIGCDDLAKAGEFDMLIWTDGNNTPEDLSKWILGHLQTPDWKEKRA